MWSDADVRLLEPLTDLVRVEADQVAPFEIRDASFSHETPDVAHADAKMLSELVDGKQPR